MIKQTIKTKEIDGYQIIVGQGRVAEDPVATQNAVKPLIAKHKHAQAIENKKRQSNEYQHRILAINREANILWRDNEGRKKKVLEKDERIRMDQLDAGWKTANVEMQKIESELIVLNGEVREDEKQLLRDNPVFFECNAGEFLFDADKTSELMGKYLAKEENSQIDIDGGIIDDYRGKIVWNKENGSWGSFVIEELGVSIGDLAGDIIDSDLTDSQRQEIQAQQEQERIAGLSAEDKQNEIDSAIDSAVEAAALMKTKLEIQEQTGALKTSRDWYKERVIEINSKYGV